MNEILYENMWVMLLGNGVFGVFVHELVLYCYQQLNITNIFQSLTQVYTVQTTIISLQVAWNSEADPEKNDQVGQSNIRGTYVWVGAPRREVAILPQEEIQGPMALGPLSKKPVSIR